MHPGFAGVANRRAGAHRESAASPFFQEPRVAWTCSEWARRRWPALVLGVASGSGADDFPSIRQGAGMFISSRYENITSDGTRDRHQWLIVEVVVSTSGCEHL